MPVPLHVHSWYSLLEGASSLDALLDRAQACGYPRLALTDTNNLYGMVAFTEKALRRGMQPILGACLRQNRTGCVALIGERAGYRSLCRILSRLHLAAMPVGLAELLCENADGLHVLAGDPVLAERLREAFGARLWLELVRPPRSDRHEHELLAASRRLGLELIASTAAHFATPDEYPTFRLVTAIRQTTLLERLPARLALTPQHHLVTPAELGQRFADLPQAVRNTDLLAEQLRSDVLPREVVLPAPRTPRGLAPLPYLRLLCERGLRRRRLGDSLSARQRLREELAVIETGDLAGYFLVVRDIARFARRQDFGMALRGSAGNSLVCYLLEITDVDPLRFDLPLERFLHPGRADLPDIDLDFDWKIRDQVIEHVFRHHGERHTAMISSHLCLQPRSAFREAGKVHGLSDPQISRLVETFTARVDELLDEPLPCPTSFPLEPERWPRLVAHAQTLLGRPHHLSIHPGGVVITPRPLEEYAPLQRAPKGIIITQFEKDAAEYLGLVKIDLLGNRALSTVGDALACFRGAAPAATDRDPATVALLQRGDTVGVNQLESPAMRHLLIQLRPEGLDDVVQALALIRPGAAGRGRKKCFVRRRRGVEPITYSHPALAELLHETQGLMIYEDDALRLVQLLTGWPAPMADRFRKRVAKHADEAEGRVLAAEFVRACDANCIPRETVRECWDQLLQFRYYTFCKSHAVSYGLIAWQSAYLKTHHPLPFWTAALNNNQGVYPRWVYIEEIKRAGLEVRLPCVNRSADLFTLEEGAIRVGLGAIASLDEQLRVRLLEDRQKHGSFRDLVDLRRRLTPGPDALALFIRCGAFDIFGSSRPALFLDADLQDREKEWAISQPSPLFPTGPLLAGSDWSPSDYALERRLRDEWQLLGFVLGPPVMALLRACAPAGTVSSRQLRAHLGRRVQVSGIVATARHTSTTDGRTMQFITLADEDGLIEVTLFPELCPPAAYLTLGPYVATGIVEEDFGVLTLTAERFERCG